MDGVNGYCDMNCGPCLPKPANLIQEPSARKKRERRGPKPSPADCTPERPKVQGGDYRPHYPQRSADAYMNAQDAEIASLRQQVELLRKAHLFGTLYDAMTKAQRELQVLKTCGVAELSLQNPNVASYSSHWEGRALNAELALAECRTSLDAALKAVSGDGLELAMVEALLATYASPCGKDGHFSNYAGRVGDLRGVTIFCVNCALEGELESARCEVQEAKRKG